MKNIPTNAGPSVSSLNPSQDEIALRAHQIWCQQGCPQGHELDNWLEAEGQLRNEFTNRRSSYPASEDIGTSKIRQNESVYSDFSEEAPLATKVDEQVVRPGRPVSRESATSLEL